MIYLAQQVAGITASIFGSCAPLIFKYYEVDPGNYAGPLETAFQDCIGINGVIIIGLLVLSNQN